MRFANPSKKTKVIASVKGHAIDFPGKGTVKKEAVPEGAYLSEEGLLFVYVPDVLHTEVMQHGMLSETEIEEEITAAGPVKPEDPAKLKDALYRVFDKLVATAARDDFSGTGAPKPAAVSRETGYTVSNSEVKEYWSQYSIDGGAQRD